MSQPMKDSRCYVIAEAGVNHNGSLERALQLVDVAADCGADAVKFQTFRAADMVSKSAPKAEYQRASTASPESQLAMLERLELDRAAHLKLAERCRERAIDFLSTPFDESSVRLLLEDVGLERLKLSSGDLCNGPLLLQIARTGTPLIVSTGMANLGEIESALGVLAFGYVQSQESPSLAAFASAYASNAGQDCLRRNVVLLHCTSAYPAPYEHVNLRALDTLRSAFALRVGLSDHTLGIAVPIAAVGRDACMIEKHFTLDRKLPGPDHNASLEPAELRAMIDGIRVVQSALGTPLKHATAVELEVRAVAHKRLTAKTKIKRGELFTPENLGVKRPGTGISPMLYWSYLGRRAQRDYEPDEALDS
jgi:N-acetylneuraminate synthase